MRRIHVVASVLCLVLVLPVLANAQQVASVTGLVTDSTGAVVQGVEVKVTDTLTGAVQTTKTSAIGVYLVSNLRPGPGYTIRFTKDGFRTTAVSDVYLGVGTTHTQNAELELGAVSQTVEVRAVGEASLNTTDATIGNVIDTRRIRDLPVQVRNSPAALLGLQAGVVANTGGGGNRVGSVTGARTDQGNITIDGMDANDVTTGQAFATTGNAPIDAIQEFRTVTTNPTAVDGRSSGGQIKLVTKSGTNDMHGSARFFNRDDFFAANSFFNNKTGIPRAKLIRNQFGGNLGGRIIKDKLFYFFDYEGRRDASAGNNLRLVPLGHVRQGQVAYINNGPGCNSQSRLNTTPSCITMLSPAQVAATDPKGIGASSAILSVLASRYPAANDLTAGDGVNIGGFRFRSPVRRQDNTYTSRVDWLPTSKQKVFARWNFARRKQTDNINNVAQQFPGDPEVAQIIVRDYAYVIGHTWNATSSIVNQAEFGVTRSGLNFPTLFKPTLPNTFNFVPIANPFPGFSSQSRFVPVPTIRDDFTYVRGQHTLQFGTSVKPIQQKSSLQNDFNFPAVGLGGLTNTLNATLRPADLLADPTGVATSQYDGMFTFLLGRYANVATNFNYAVNGTPFPLATGKSRNFHYNELEFYGQDQWRLRPSLTFTYGLRWQYYSVPFEANGFQALQDVDLQNLFGIRRANAAAGVSGNSSEPLLRYDLGGKANGRRGYSDPSLTNFSPRVALAYNPSYHNGLLGRIFGDRKTVVRLGGSIVYDRVGGAITFIQDQVAYIFDNRVATSFGNADARVALLNDPRFTGFNTLPVTNAPPVIVRPFTPFAPGGSPNGNATNQFNYAVDQHFRTPYAHTFSFGVQRELPGSFILETNYVGRLGRRLFTQADAAQVLDFNDLASGQSLTAAFNNLQSQIQNNLPTSSQPWFENQMNAAIAANFGQTCATRFAGSTCTAVVRTFFTNTVRQGGLATLVGSLFGNRLLPPNVGESSQFGSDTYISSLGSSSYNALLLNLRKRYSQNLQLDFSYTLSHSIDNQSSIVNTVTGGLVCDLTNFHVCRGNSDFDARHQVTANWVYELPVGRGQSLGRSMPGWLDRVLGGWEVSGILSWRTGFAFGSSSGVTTVSRQVTSPAVLAGSLSALGEGIHTDASGNLIYFSDATAAKAALRSPVGGETGNRNNLVGAHFSNVDLAVLKNFKMPWSENHRLQFRWEAFNAFNHVSFLEPNATITSGNFGFITGERSTPREMQFALRYDF